MNKDLYQFYLSAFICGSLRTDGYFNTFQMEEATGVNVQKWMDRIGECRQYTIRRYLPEFKQAYKDHFKIVNSALWKTLNE
jgi:hypothetical protein